MGDSNTLHKRIQELEAKVRELEGQLQEKSSVFSANGPTVSVEPQFQSIFQKAEETVKAFFSHFHADPTAATIEIAGQRYVLVRGSSLSYDFLRTIANLYADRGQHEAFLIGKQLLFDVAHVIGKKDAHNFHTHMGLEDPISKLAAGPVHFAYTGWASVDILPQSDPSPTDDYVIVYHHPYSFEADSWQAAGIRSDLPVCSMNAGYSSGWCEESFGLELTSVEIKCRACGDDTCTFVMAPPHRIQEHLQRFAPDFSRHQVHFEIPTFFDRKRVEEEREAARNKAEESDKAKTQFLAKMSHEIRTPLHAILGYVDIMLSHNKSREEQKEYLTVIQESGELLQQLLSDILDLSKIEAGELPLQYQRCSLTDLFQKMQSMAQGLLSSCDVTFDYQIPEQLQVSIRTDTRRLQQILNNLLGNAIKYTQEGSITLSVAMQSSNTLVFSVRDTGIGIPTEAHNTVFQMFTQAHETTQVLNTGVGLGLTITKRLVELLGGEIWLESVEHVGTTFSFTHPFTLWQDEEAQPLQQEQDTPPQGNGQHILVVDDNAINLRLTTLTLKQAGYQVSQAQHGAEALTLFHSDHSIALVLMDMQMPVLDGLEATKAIRQLEDSSSRPPTPVIALTAHALQGELERSLKAGCNLYLTKPISRSDLLQAIHQYLIH
ncbi:MAG: response regulator [Deltaproteobacteria bacterium]|nr:MAG: response regulator [Deltaproteobacteria bacterium]